MNSQSKNLLSKITETLNIKSVRYCHWKSNNLLDDAISGKTDFDILVHYEDHSLFNSILSDFDFKLSIGPRWDSHPSIFHYYSLDTESGKIVHFHVYYRMITGGGLLKDYRFPVESKYLHNTRLLSGVQVPAKHHELIIFCLRKLLEHTDIFEMLLLTREKKGINNEIKWLCDQETVAAAKKTGSEFLPPIDKKLLNKCIDAFIQSDSSINKIVLGFRLAYKLRGYSCTNTIQKKYVSVCRFTAKCYQKFTSKKHINKFCHGGRVIAIIGGEATGKSTITRNTCDWLDKFVKTSTYHSGKPKSSWLTFWISLFLPLLRKLFPKHRSGVVEFENNKKSNKNISPNTNKNTSLIHGIRAVLLAFERYKLLTRAFRQATKGQIVICDRYPTKNIGDIDSAMLAPGKSNKATYTFLQKLEHSIYESIPTPDLILKLSVPIEMAVQRNLTRDKKGLPEPEDFIRQRHSMVDRLNFPDTKTVIISTNKDLEETMLDVKSEIWKIIS